MRCVKKTRTRCECDFCGKKNWSIGHMKRHELHCTKNPDRECGVCKMIEATQKPISELLILLPTPTEYRHEDEYGCFGYDEGFSDMVDEAVLKIRELTENCPACIMSAIRQKGIHMNQATKFSFSDDMKSIWSDVNERNLQDNGYIY